MDGKFIFKVCCQSPCEWMISGSRVRTNGAFSIKNQEGFHTCPRAMRNKIATSNWIARKHFQVFKLKLNMSCKYLGRDLMQRYAGEATRWKLFHSKKKLLIC